MKESKTIYSYLIEHMESPSFYKVRDLACDFVRKLPKELCEELHKSLNRGADILDSEALLQMYFYSFGEMHAAKLNYAFEHLQKYIKEAKKVELIDYGCGQGIASMCYHDFISNANSSQEITRVTLIDPSEMALSRASLLCSRFYPNSEIKTVNKDFESLTENDIKISKLIPTIHLFSNILDLESFNIEKFARLVKSVSVGDNEYVIISPFQNVSRMKRLKDFVAILNYYNYFEQYFEKREFRYDKDWTCVVMMCSSKNEKKDYYFNLDDLYETAYSLLNANKNDEIKCIEVFHKLNIAAFSGDMKCQNALGVFYYEGIGTPKDYVKAFEWLKKSADQGFTRAFYNLAICYVNGLGVEKDQKKAVELLEYASEQNDLAAQSYLGYCYLKGKGVTKDATKGLKLLKSASDNNCAIAHRLLGVCYRKGICVNVDISMAITYFTKAGILDDKKSIIYLIEIFEEKDYKNLFGDEQFDVFVRGVHLGMSEIERVTVTWFNKEPEKTYDEDVVYGSNGLRIIQTLTHEFPYKIK